MKMRIEFPSTMLALLGLISASYSHAAASEFDLETATVADIDAAMDAGALSSERLVELSLARIKAFEPNLHAIISLNPHALDEARALDAERKSRGRRSALHGVPVLLKDNINTRDLPTTLGFYGLEGAIPSSDALVVTKLREAGAIILAKMNLSELASGPTMSSLGGQTHNPYNLAYSPAGSSSGTAVGVAAGYASIGLGTDTAGSIRWPAATNGVFGLKPTNGVISCWGVMPSAPTMDTVGLITRSATDAALVLVTLQGIDPRSAENTAALGAFPPPYPADFANRLRPDALRGARIGFLRRDFSGDDTEVDGVMNSVVEKFKAGGAVIVDVQLPYWLLAIKNDVESIIYRTESVPSLDSYLLASFPPGVPRTHDEIMALSAKLTAPTAEGFLPNPGRLAGYRNEAATPPANNPLYRAARDEGRAFIKASVQSVIDQYRLDALIYPTQTTRIPKIGEAARRNAKGFYGNVGGSIANLTGWPEISFPGGFTTDGFPVGISLTGPLYSDMQLLAYAFAFEQSNHLKNWPATTPVLPGEQFHY
jgi:amidase